MMELIDVSNKDNRLKIATYIDSLEGNSSQYWIELYEYLKTNKYIRVRDGNLVLSNNIDIEVQKFYRQLYKFTNEHDENALRGYSTDPFYDLELGAAFYLMLIPELTSKSGNYYSAFEIELNKILFKARSSNRPAYNKFVDFIGGYFKLKGKKGRQFNLLYSDISNFDKSLAFDLKTEFIKFNNFKDSISRREIENYVQQYYSYFEIKYIYHFLVNIINLVEGQPILTEDEIKNIKVNGRKVKDDKGLLIQYLEDNSHKRILKFIAKEVLDNLFRRSIGHKDYSLTKSYLLDSRSGHKFSYPLIRRKYRQISDLYWAIIYISQYHLSLRRSEYSKIPFSYGKRGDNIHNRGLRCLTFDEAEGQLNLYISQFLVNTFHISKFRRSDVQRVYIVRAPIEEEGYILLLDQILLPSGILLNKRDFEILKMYKGKRVNLYMKSIIPYFQLKYQKNIPPLEIGEYKYHTISQIHRSMMDRYHRPILDVAV